MKKLLIILAFGAIMMSTSSCRFIHETFYSVEGCTEWYCEEILDAYADGDLERAQEREQQMNEWCAGLDYEDQLKAWATAGQWLSGNGYL